MSLFKTQGRDGLDLTTLRMRDVDVSDIQDKKHRPFCVLQVEDDDNHATLVQRVIKRHAQHTSLIQIDNGADALDYLLTHPPPDLILLDLKIPQLDGHRLLETIKSSDHLRSIPVVILTTSNNDLDRERAYANHVNSYLVKPLDFKRFRHMLCALLEYWGTWNILIEAKG